MPTLPSVFWAKRRKAPRKKTAASCGAAVFMVSCYNKASQGARNPAWLAGRIGKQVQDLRGTAAVMAELERNFMSLHTGVGRRAFRQGSQSRKTCLEIHTAGYNGTNRRRIGCRTRAADGPNVGAENGSASCFEWRFVSVWVCPAGKVGTGPFFLRCDFIGLTHQ